MSSASITPYLFFSGRCEEALKFYEQALGAKVEMLMRFNESPDPTPPGLLQPGFETKVMHASLTIGGIRLMASDGCDDRSSVQGFKLAYSLPTEAEAQRVFNALAQGGEIEMPLAKTFWSPCFGMLADQFKIEWMIMVPGEQPWEMRSMRRPTTERNRLVDNPR